MKVGRAIMFITVKDKKDFLRKNEMSKEQKDKGVIMSKNMIIW